MMSNQTAAAMTLVLAAGALVFPFAASGQVTAASPSALATANNYSALARGFTAIALNPAGLALPGNPGFSLTLIPAEVKAGLSAMSLGDIAQYDGQKIPDVVKQEWLQTVTEDDGFELRGGASVAGLALSIGPVGLQIATVGNTRSSLSPDAFELLMFGNAGLTGTARDMSLAGSSTSWGATTGALAFAIPLPSVKNGSFAVGATLKYTVGHVGVTAVLDSSSVVTANPFSFDISVPVILPTGFNLDGLKNNGTGVGMDLGLAWEGETWVFSAALQNVFNTFEWDLDGFNYGVAAITLDGTSVTGEFNEVAATVPAPALLADLLDQRFKFAINMGVAYRQSDKLALMADFRHDTGDRLIAGERSRIGLGAEWKLLQFLPLRGGVSFVSGGAVQLAAGLGLELGPVKLSGGYLTEKGSAGEFRAASFALSFGG